MDVYFCAAHLFPKSGKQTDPVTEKPETKPKSVMLRFMMGVCLYMELLGRQ